MTDTPITQSQLDALEKAADKVFAKLGIDIEFTRHFIDRVNDERNRKQITIRELGNLLAKEYQRWGKTIGNMPVSAEAVMKDLSSAINIPFVMKKDGNEKDLVAKTVMRKKDFKTPDKTLPVESVNEAMPNVNLSGRSKRSRIRATYTPWKDKIHVTGRYTRQGKLLKIDGIYDTPEQAWKDISSSLGQYDWELKPKPVESVNEAKKLSSIEKVIKAFNATTTEKNHIDYIPPGTSTWTRGDGTRYRDPGKIVASWGAKTNKKPVIAFVEWLKTHPKAKTLSGVSDWYGSSAAREAFVLGSVLFTVDDTGRVEFGSTSRLRNTDVWKKKTTSVSEDDDPCWDNYKQVGMKKKNGKQVPNCVPESETHGAKRGTQVKGSDATPSKRKPTKGGETPHPMRGKLVGEAVEPLDPTAKVSMDMITQILINMRQRQRIKNAAKDALLQSFAHNLNKHGSTVNVAMKVANAASRRRTDLPGDFVHAFEQSLRNKLDRSYLYKKEAVQVSEEQSDTCCEGKLGEFDVYVEHYPRNSMYMVHIPEGNMPPFRREYGRIDLSQEFGSAEEAMEHVERETHNEVEWIFTSSSLDEEPVNEISDEKRRAYLKKARKSMDKYRGAAMAGKSIAQRDPNADDAEYWNDYASRMGKKYGKRNLSIKKNRGVAGEPSWSAKNPRFQTEMDQRPLDVKTPTPSAIAKKHGVDVDMIMQQLRKGVKVEMEHTTDKKAAIEIALDHLNEMPDYYSKLSDMEGDLHEMLTKGAWEVQQIREDWQGIKVGMDPREAILKKALHYLEKMHNTKGDEQDIGGYAFDIARSFNLKGIITPRELAKLYREWKGIKDDRLAI